LTLCLFYVDYADAKTNINLAEMKKTYENTNHSIHLIPIGRIGISRLPYNNILLGGRENVKYSTVFFSSITLREGQTQ